MIVDLMKLPVGRPKRCECCREKTSRIIRDVYGNALRYANYCNDCIKIGRNFMIGSKLRDIKEGK